MANFIEWEDRYSTGIPAIDDQHKELIALTNNLYESCQAGVDVANKQFAKALHAAVDYVKTHFGFEERLLQQKAYPYLEWHKTQHAGFIKKILEDAKRFDSGEAYVPNGFVRYLRDWILSHIALADKAYAKYILNGDANPPPMLKK
jgi:hemerythrin